MLKPERAHSGYPPDELHAETRSAQHGGNRDLRDAEEDYFLTRLNRLLPKLG